MSQIRFSANTSLLHLDPPYVFTISTDSSQRPLFAWKEMVRSFLLPFDMHLHVIIVYDVMYRAQEETLWKKKKKTCQEVKGNF